MRKTPKQMRANHYAAFRLLALGMFLGFIWATEPTVEAHIAWLCTAAGCWPYKPDWRT